jgi:hypothetical protein
VIDGLLAPWRSWTALAPALVGPIYPLASAAHILSIALLVGSIAALDLRLLGCARAASLAAWPDWLARLSTVGFGGALATGFLLFSVQPAHYLGNGAFGLKLVLIMCAAANALAVRRSDAWRALADGVMPGPGIRIAAALSLVLWASVVVAGRWIAFV